MTDSGFVPSGFTPSQIPGTTPEDRSLFGTIAEIIIFYRFLRDTRPIPFDLFVDARIGAELHNDYHRFVAQKNPPVTYEQVKKSFDEASAKGVKKIPDILVHSASEQGYYEIKPDSDDGRREAVGKAGKIDAAFKHLAEQSGVPMPYRGLTSFKMFEETIARGVNWRLKLVTRYLAEGLIVYRLKFEGDVVAELAVIVALVIEALRRLNARRKDRILELPVPMPPLPLPVPVPVAVRRVAPTWRHFWLAVAAFIGGAAAIRIAASAAVVASAADGPLPFGEAASAVGLSATAIVLVLANWDRLWGDAQRIAEREANGCDGNAGHAHFRAPGPSGLA